MHGNMLYALKLTHIVVFLNVCVSFFVLFGYELFPLTSLCWRLSFHVCVFLFCFDFVFPEVAGCLLFKCKLLKIIFLVYFFALYKLHDSTHGFLYPTKNLYARRFWQVFYLFLIWKPYLFSEVSFFRSWYRKHINFKQPSLTV